MDNTTNSIFNFFLDKSKSIGYKTAILISILGFLFISDFSLNFTYNLNVNNKLEQLSNIQILKKEYSKDSLNLNKLIKLENEIINKRHYSEYLDLSKIEFEEKTIPKPTKNLEIKKFSAFWMAISSSYSLVLMFPIILLLPFFTKEKEKNFTWAWIAMMIIWISIIVLITVISYQIPLVSGKAMYNYWLNFGIHSILLILLFWRPFKKK